MRATKIITTCSITFIIIFGLGEKLLSQNIPEGLEDIVEKRKASEYIDKAESSIQTGDLEIALKYYDKAIEVYPKNAKVYIMRGNVKKELGNLEGAINDYSLAISTEPITDYNENSLQYEFAKQKDAEAYFYRGTSRATLNLHEEAIKDYSRSIKLYDGFKLLYILRGISFIEIDKISEACEDFQEALNDQEYGDTARELIVENC